MKQVKEVYVGVIPRDDGTGKIVCGTIMFAGPNPFIPKGIYDEKNPPPGWEWKPFLIKAKKHDGHGVTVIYEGDEKPKLRKVMVDEAERAKKQEADQEKIRQGKADEKPESEVSK